MERLTVGGTGEAKSDVTIQDVLNKLKYYEDLEEQERLLIQAFAIESTAECPDCGHSGIMIAETWIRPELLQHDRFYATRSEAEQALKKMEEMR